MGELTKFKDLPINWDIGPADAVALHLEWGNTGYGGGYATQDEVSYYFSVDSWEKPFRVRLQKMTSDGPTVLHEIELPQKFWGCCDHACGSYTAPDDVKEWLKTLF